MIELVSQGALERRRAERVAKAIHESNPYHINENVLRAFLRKLAKFSS